MPVSDAVRVRHILDAAQEAVAFVSGRSRADLDTDRMLGLALVRLLEIIGEAARGVSENFRELHPEVAWNRMTGMRDRLVHGYFDVNLGVVWETVAQDLPLLIDQVGKIVASSGL
jgi:uncharacterized protein with HEPN domain